MSKSSWREYQDSVENNGWRIKMIHPGDPNRVRWHKTRWGALCFVAVFLYGVATKNIRVILPGLLGMPLAVFVELLIEYRLWRRVEAEVLDVEMRRVGGSKVGQEAWATRLLCRYSLDGKTYEVTPISQWAFHYFRDDASAELSAKYEQKERERLASTFISENRVRLYVNTREPLEAKLDNGSFATRVIHSFSTNAR